MINLRRYREDDKTAWDEFIRISKNGIFLFFRDYMDYHKDRFIDHSLVFEKNNKTIAVLPANENDKALVSHGGLTFGGLVMHPGLRAVEVLEIFELLIDYCKRNGFQTLLYKPSPPIFHNHCAGEDLYALFRCGAQLYRRDLSTVLCLQNKVRFSETKRQMVTKCKNASVQVVEATDFTAYWSLLEEVLFKFDTRPVHSLEEIQYLKNLFPDKIKLFEARLDEELLAGIVLYDFGQTVHTQYMANSSKGRTMGALDYINSTLIDTVYSDRGYYSWGISTEQEGKALNTGLIQQKEMMGGRGIVLDFYRIDL